MPVYWEQFEPREGHFDFTNIDQIVTGARAHNLHLIVLWFGTWKNGNMHYVPAWVKENSQRFPNTIRPDGEPIDVLSPNSRNTLDADKAAFTALMRHLKQIDGEQHTVLMVQVENESGIWAVFATTPPPRTRSLPVRFQPISLLQPKSSPAPGLKFSARMPTKSFSSTIRPSTLTKSSPRAKPSSIFPAISMCGSALRFTSWPSARSFFQASNIPAVARCRSGSASGEL